MGSKRGVLIGAGFVLLSLLAGALWLVMQEPVHEAAPEVADVSAAAPEESPDEAAGGRRRSGRVGSCVVLGRVVRGRERVDAAGVTVTLARDGIPPWAAETGPDGSFRFEDLPAGGPYEVSITVDEFAPVRVPGIGLDRREERDVGELRLDASVSVTLLVKDTRDAPISGARVDAFVTSYGGSADWTKRLAQIGVEPVSIVHGSTGPDGRVTFPDLAVGRYTFRARAAGFASGGARGKQLEADEDAREFTIRLLRGHTVSGHVAYHDETPVANALVMGIDGRGAWDQAAAPLHVRATSDEEGAFQLDGLDVGDTAIWVGLADGVPAQVAFIIVPRVGTLDLTLRLGGTLHGTVTLEETGEPVPGVSVRATSWVNNSSRVAEVVTDAEGKYVIDTLLEGLVNQLVVDQPGYVVAREKGESPWTQVPLNNGDEIKHDIKLRKAVVLTGVIRSKDGPVPGAKLTLHLSRANQGWNSFNATADADGRYRFDALESGKALIQVSKHGYFQPDYPAEWWTALQQNAVPESCSADLPESGEVTRDLEIIKGGTVTGRVELHGGGPLAGATVATSGAGSGSGSTETDAEGAFTLQGVALGTEVTVSASLEGHTTATEKTRAGAEDVLLRLYAAATVRGTVTTHDGGDLDDAFVQLRMHTKQDANQPWNWQDPDRRWAWAERGAVLPGGTFELPMSATKGQFVVRVSSGGYAPVDSEPIDVVEGQAEYTVDLQLTEGLTLRGKALDSVTGGPIVGAFVTFGRQAPGAESQPWYDQNVQRPIFAVTDGEGAFELPWLGDGQYKLTVKSDGHVDKAKTVTLPATTEITLKLDPALEIAGFVHYADGTPVEGAQIQSQPAGGGMPVHYNNQQIVTSSDGRFRIPNLSAGKYNVSVNPPWQGKVNIKSVQVASVEAGTTDLDIEAERGGAIGGVVTDVAGQPVGGVYVNAQPENPGDGQVFWRGTSTAADGSFELVGLDDDTFTLNVGANNGYQEVKLPGISVGSTDVVIKLTKGQPISGSLFDDAGDARVGETLSAQRILEEGEPQTMRSYHSTQTLADGAFEFTGLGDGHYVISRQTWGMNGKQKEDAHLVLQGGSRVAAGTMNLRLVLSVGGSISGVVRSAAGEGVRGVMVNATMNGNSVRGVSTKSDGAFEITGLADDGEYELVAKGGKWRPSRVPAIATGATGVAITVVEGLTASGRVTDATGIGRAKQGLSFKHKETEESTWVNCDDDGAFLAQGLEEGVYSVRAFVHAKDADGNNLQHGNFVELGELAAGDGGVLLELPE